jgi:hypothetical protein
MMPVTLSVLSAALLGVFLWRVWESACLPESQLLYDSDVSSEEWATCPREFIATVFCPDDWEFVSKFNSEPLKALFMQERKSIARAWVRATAGSIRHIMREHAQISRRSSDLEIGVELRIYLRYAALQASCAFLLLSIGLVNPARLRALSLHVYQLSEHLSYAHWALKAVTESKELQGLWHA